MTRSEIQGKRKVPVDSKPIKECVWPSKRIWNVVDVWEGEKKEQAKCRDGEQKGIRKEK